MTFVQVVAAVASLLGALGIGWGILNSLKSKKEDEQRRAEDEKLRLERVQSVDAALARLEATASDSNRELKRINGLVARHDFWIEEHKRTTDPAMDAFRALQLDVNRLKDQVAEIQARSRRRN